MKLDGNISNGIVGLVFFIGYILLMWRLAPRRPKQYNRPDKVAVVTPFNLFDQNRWTKEGLDYNRRVARFVPVALLALIAGWLILDTIW